MDIIEGPAALSPSETEDAGPDILERRQAEMPWAMSDLVIASSFADATRLAILAIRLDGTIEFVNPATEKLFGYEPKEMIGQPIQIIVPERFRGAHSTGLSRYAAGAKPNLEGKTVEVWALRKDGREFPIEITLSMWENERGKFAGAMIKDISDRREREDRLLRLASQDTLTGLCNRSQFVELLQTELAAGRSQAVFLLDLDGFKDVNDTHGHAMGDAVLQAIGVRLPYILPHGAPAARFGGDEFAFFVPGINDPNLAKEQALAILEGFSAPFEIAGLIFHVGASLGYVLSAGHTPDAEELIASADLALYRAKASGGQNQVFYEPEMRTEAQALRDMRDEVRLALRQGELELYYQPQIGFDNQSVFGVEALIRWNHPVRGLLPPHAFLPAIEQSSLALDVGWWTLDQACRHASDLNVAGYEDLRVSVNLFSAQVRSANLFSNVMATLEKYELEPHRLELEITETIALYDDSRCLDVMNRLRQAGVGIAFDDFGTGFASLSTIQRYPLTTLKIDRSFVTNLAQRPRDAAIVRALVGLSNDMGLVSIAEGIETAEQEAVVRGLGCQGGQGFLYGKPMSALELLSFLAGRKSQFLARSTSGKQSV